MISIVAKFVVKEGKEAKFLELVAPLVKASNEEEGCMEYALHKHIDKPGVYTMIEKWKDKAAVDFHNNTPHFTSIVPQIVELASAEVDLYESI
jgi:quinol monooxygenase YgiN